MNIIPRSHLSDIDSMFDDFFTGFPVLLGRSDIAGNLASMRVDIHENANDFEIKAELPGVKKEDISVTLTDDTLTISASREAESESRKHGRVIRRERSSGSYSRSFTVGEGIRQEDIKARFVDGVLTLTVPKVMKEEIQSKVQKIDIG